MSDNRLNAKLNAQKSLILVSILYLVNAGIGTLLAVQANLPAEFFGKDGKPALEDFLFGNGTALSAPLYLCIILVLFIILSFQLRRLGTFGIIGLTILGVCFIIGALGEPITYKVLNPATFDLPKALVVMIEIVLPLLMVTFGIIELVNRKHVSRISA
jgi:hypothetical protein